MSRLPAPTAHPPDYQAQRLQDDGHPFPLPWDPDGELRHGLGMETQLSRKEMMSWASIRNYVSDMRHQRQGKISRIHAEDRPAVAVQVQAARPGNKRFPGPSPCLATVAPDGPCNTCATPEMRRHRFSNDRPNLSDRHSRGKWSWRDGAEDRTA